MIRRARGHRTCWPIAALLLVTRSAAQGDAPDELLQLESVLQRAVRAVAPAVVTVDTFGGAGSRQPRGATTGVVLTRDGWVLVARYALESDPSSIVVTLADGRRCEARRAGEDTSRGLALLRIAASDLPMPEFVRPEEARVGQWTFVVGRPFGRSSPSVHMGILSAVKRLFGRALQIDAWTSPANYGGPVIDIDGRVLGIAVPLSRSGRDAGVELYDSGIGFAVTIADIGDLLERMQRGEILHRGWLGIEPDHEHLGPGARIRTVSGGSAADGVIEPGDVITMVDGTPIRNGYHLVDAVNARMSGDALALTLERRGEARELRVVLQALSGRQREPRPLAEEAGVPPWEEDAPESGR